MEIRKPSSKAGFSRARIKGLQKFSFLMRRAFPGGIREAVRQGTTPPELGRPCPADTASPCCRQVPHGDDSGSTGKQPRVQNPVTTIFPLRNLSLTSSSTILISDEFGHPDCLARALSKIFFIFS